MNAAATIEIDAVTVSCPDCGESALDSDDQIGWPVRLEAGGTFILDDGGCARTCSGCGNSFEVPLRFDAVARAKGEG